MKRSLPYIDALPVFNGGNDKTIWSNPSVNLALRAWHDALHVTKNADFSLHGEAVVAWAQVEQLHQWFKGAPWLADLSYILLAEVVGQAEEYWKTGEFVDDQRGFMLERFGINAA